MNAVVGVPRAAIANGPASRSSFPSSRTDAATVVPPLPPPAPSADPASTPATPQLALKRSVSVKAVADSKINTDEVLKTIADKVRDARSRARPAGPPSPPLPSHYVRAPRQVFFFCTPVDRSSIPHPPLAPDPSPSPAFAAPARPDPPA